MSRSHQCTSQICIIGDHSLDRAKLELYPKHDRVGLAHYLYEVILVVGACITEDGLERVRSRLPCNKGCLWRSKKYQATRTLHQYLCTLKPSCAYPQNPDTAFPSPAPRLGIVAVEFHWLSTRYLLSHIITVNHIVVSYIIYLFRCSLPNRRCCVFSRLGLLLLLLFVSTTSSINHLFRSSK